MEVLMSNHPKMTEELDPRTARYLELLLDGKRREASEMIHDLVESGTGIREIYLGVFQPAQCEIGRRWQENRLSVAQEHFVTAATQLIMSQLYPHVFAADRCGRTLVATCVVGELHEIGVRMVCDFFEMEGWDTYYLGANSSPESVVAAVADRQADLIGISVTFGKHLDDLRQLIDALRQSPESAHAKIMVGGLPFTLDDQLWLQVGADGFAVDADKALVTARGLLETAEA